MATRLMTNWVYTDDDGVEYATKAPADIIAQVNGSSEVIVGGRDYTGDDVGLPPMPGRTRLRPRVRIYNATGQSPTRVVCYDATCDAYGATPPNLNLPKFGAAAGAYSPGKRVAENKAGRNASH